MATETLTTEELNAPGGMSTADGGVMSGYTPLPDSADIQTDAGVAVDNAVSTETLAPQGDFTFPETDIPPADIGVESAALEATGNTMMENIQTQLSNATEEAKTAKEQSLDDLLGALNEQKGFEGYYADEMKKREVQQLQNNIATQKGIIRSEQAARNYKKAKLEAEGGGLKMGANAEYYNFARDSLFNETNAVIQMGVYSDQYAAAEAAATRIANAYFQQEQNDIAIKQSLYLENKDLFTKREQREFEVTFEQAKRELDQQQAEMERLQTTKLDALKMARLNGAPSEIINAIANAKSIEEIYQNGGQYAAVDMLERKVMAAQLNKLLEKPEATRQTQVIEQGDRKLLIDSTTGEVIKDFGETDISTDELTYVKDSIQVQKMDDIKSHKGLNSAVGSTWAGRIGIADSLSGAKDDFIASVEQMTKGMTLTELQEAKANGATFGSLQVEEMRVLAGAATKINGWKLEEDDGKVTGYDVSQKDFLKEMDVITNYTKLDKYLTHKDNPNYSAADFGLVEMNDGTIWAKNSDGTLSKLR